MIRRIVHLDMDAFFASVEQRDRPELRGRPVVVGGRPDSRGVVAAASYEARRFGVKSAMSCAEAARRCPDAVFLMPDIARYRAVSEQLRAIMREVTDQIEPISFDEAYLDVTDNRLGLVLGRDVAIWLREAVRERLHLTASAGVGPNKLVAKIASDQRKPDGLTVVAPEQVQAFLAPLDVRRLWGVGPKLSARLYALELRTIGDLAAADEAWLREKVGDQAYGLRKLALGEDPRPVCADRVRRSRSSEHTFERDVLDVSVLRDVMRELAEETVASVTKHEEMATTVVLKLRYDDFTTVTRSLTLQEPTASAHDVCIVADLLLARTEAGVRPVRLVGIGLSGLGPPPAQLAFAIGLAHEAGKA